MLDKSQSLFLLIVLVAIKDASSALRFANSYGDHMVLQRGPQRAVIRGYANRIGEEVVVTILGHGSGKGKVTKDPHSNSGTWKVKLPTIWGAGPFTISASSNEGTIQLHDVLFGDVWICSGQSNMGLPLKKIINGSQAIAEGVHHDQVRFFKLNHDQQPSPISDIKKPAFSWTKPNKATLAEWSAVCFLFGRNINTNRKYPIGMIEADWGGSPIATWSSPHALAQCHGIKGRKRFSWNRSQSWNGMIEPILSMTIKGVIWYQGEANTWGADLYNCNQNQMIADWRHRFNQASLGETSINFPFGFVQLPGYRNTNEIGNWPYFRWTQTAYHGYAPNANQKNVFMAVTIDLPDYAPHPDHEIHPRHKLDVAYRLALSARAVAYGEKVDYQGPFPKSFNVHFNTKTLFIHYNHPIQLRHKGGFEVCCSATSKTKCDNNHWVNANNVGSNQDYVSVSYSGCQGNQHLVGVRYIWKETPCTFKNCPIYGVGSNLPAPTFIKYGEFEGNTPIIGK